MTSRPSAPASLSLEARTQAIGHELFAKARQAHAHLSVLNRWTAQVLSWCLSDPELKSRVLRFIDVLPSLQGPRDVARHVREYFPPGFRMPAALQIGSQLARPGLLTQGALAVIIRQLVEQVARQFIAEARPEGAAEIVQALASRQAACSLDVLGEQVLTEAEADRYVAQCCTLLRESASAYAALPPSVRLATCGSRVSLSVKPSALTPRFDPISPTASIERAARRLLPLLQEVDADGALIYLDMEQYELRDLTIALAQHLLLHPRRGAGATLGVVVQSYLRDAEANLEELLSWLTAHEHALTIRLVKGAYWDYEASQAAQRHWPMPVHREKAGTDLAFERLTQRLLRAAPRVTTAIASHNVRSIAHAMAVAEALGLSKEHLEFQLLYGMGDAIHAAIVSMGYPVRIYTPIGELIPGMAYLVRRILENTANESFLRQDFFQERSAEELLRAPAASSEPAAVCAAPAADERRIGEPLAEYFRDSTRQRMREALASVRRRFGRSYPLLIGADEVETTETFTVRNPALTTEVVGRVAQAKPADVDRAVQMAAEAQPRWAATPVGERVAVLRRAAGLMRNGRDELTALEVIEVGKPWREADADVVEAIEYLEYYSEEMLGLSQGRPLVQVPGERNTYTYVPRGIAAVIAPWNFPVAILTGMASAALAAGNAVILKPAEQSSVIAAHVARLFREAGIPASIVQFLPGLGEEAGAALVRHPSVHAVLFTGSRAVGMSIVEACAKVAPGQRFFKHVVAELGGKNAILIDADADLDAAVDGALRSAFGYGGQKCSAASRVIVHRAVYERFLPRFSAAADRLVVGDPADPGTDMGPLIDGSAQRRLLDAIASAGERASVAYRYPASRMPTSGYFVGPALVTDVSSEDRLAREELFGPLACVFRVESFEDALALANDTDYALTGGVYSRSPSHLELAVRSFDVGNLYLNRPITGSMVGRQPFGGHRLSGLGTKAGGPDYLLQLLIPKTVCVNTTRHGMPLD
ncbi:MAG: bifunctional proline dehydrogenase/L-glutamate gamma-semialdehyde dehydrogenase [Candidatus Omnitrophica bacterium]|nr:bifunctional proline dehydrogenase/L-glutamate gamma-semialdehyde dehydrogenase [Candidatus Omnitrophota bacterium]